MKESIRRILAATALIITLAGLQPILPIANASDPVSIPTFNVTTYLTAKDQKNTDAPALKAGIGGIAVRLINQLSFIIGSFAFLAIVVGGFFYLTSAGQENQITKAKTIVKYAITGLVIGLSSYYITLYVQKIFYEFGP